jgi:hypothetical protein
LVPSGRVVWSFKGGGLEFWGGWFGVLRAGRLEFRDGSLNPAAVRGDGSDACGSDSFRFDWFRNGDGANEGLNQNKGHCIRARCGFLYRANDP